MSDKFDAIEQAVTKVLERVSKLPDQLELSTEDRSALVSEIANELKATMKQCLTEAIRTTQEAPKVEPVTPIASEKKEETK